MTACRYCGTPGAYDSGFTVECVHSKCSVYSLSWAQASTQRPDTPCLENKEEGLVLHYQDSGVFTVSMKADGEGITYAAFHENDSGKVFNSSTHAGLLAAFEWSSLSLDISDTCIKGPVYYILGPPRVKGTSTNLSFKVTLLPCHSVFLNFDYDWVTNLSQVPRSITNIDQHLACTYTIPVTINW